MGQGPTRRESSELCYHELKASGELPSPTGVALELLELTDRDDSTLAEIADTIKADPALSGRLLKFANSPFVGQTRTIASIRDAVLLVGMHVLRQLVLGLSVLSNNRKGACEAFDYGRFWSHSLAVAVATQALCTRRDQLPPDEGFTCGLLSGIGKLALATIYPQAYGQILENYAQRSGDFSLLGPERAEFMLDHLQLGAAMVKDWGLPPIHYLALQNQYQPEAFETDDVRARLLAGVLDLAASLADVVVADDTMRAALLPDLLAKAERNQLGEQDVTQLFNNVTHEWREWGGLLEVKTGDVPQFSELLERRQRAEAVPLAESAGRLRILVVDDDPIASQILSKQLRDAGHQVIAAENGRAALEISMSNTPQLIISDWLMPEMNGLELVRALRKTRIGQRLYIIIVTAQEDESCVVAGFEAGADDYLVKPIEPRILEARIRAGQRLIDLQNEVERERDENRQYISELAVANRRLEQASLTDPLTGLPNRRQATHRLQQTWSAAERADSRLACMVIDIDNFKKINDTYGHADGDTALIEVATLLRSAARNDDEVCRVGGEEFLVICSDSSANAAKATAERLRMAVEQQPIKLGGRTLDATISIGVAVRRARKTTPDKLLITADKAVYTAKRSGKNCVVVSADEGDSPGLRAIK